MPTTLPKFMIFGHRGTIGVDGIGENTLAAFERGLQDGADGIEFDVYCVKDNSGESQLVAIHDDNLERTTNGHGLVMGYSFEELRQLDAGKGEKIPTFEEILHAITSYKKRSSRDITINVELKGPSTAEPLAAAIQGPLAEGWSLEDFVISSFNHDQLRKFHELLPDTATAVLVDADQWESYGHTIQPAVEVAAAVGAMAINPGYAFLSVELIDEIHANGFKAYVWTGDTPTKVKAIQLSGADGVFANDPASARSALRL